MNNEFIQIKKKKWFQRKSLIFPVIFIVLVLTSVISLPFYIKSSVRQPSSISTEEVKFSIFQGESTQQIGKRLEKDKLIKNSWIFVVYLKYIGKSTSLQVGDYTLKRSYTALEVIEVLTKGKVTSGKITIPEGWTNKQIGEEVQKKGIGTEADFEKALKKHYGYDFLKESPTGDLQGFLFPNTYFLSSKANSEDVVEKMLKEFSDTADKKIRAKVGVEGLDYYQMLTLASIVEREVTSKEDKRVVAGIFYNRLQNGIKLDSCATVEYVLGTKKRILSNEDISIDSPYNTYKIEGLPPTPIANPGLDSIDAVLNPDKNDYLFFFSGKDGKTYFSKTQEEHEEKTAKYL